MHDNGPSKENWLAWHIYKLFSMQLKFTHNVFQKIEFLHNCLTNFQKYLPMAKILKPSLSTVCNKLVFTVHLLIVSDVLVLTISQEPNQLFWYSSTSTRTCTIKYIRIAIFKLQYLSTANISVKDSASTSWLYSWAQNGNKNSNLQLLPKSA